jgi:FixJ family two-component response regulator
MEHQREGNMSSMGISGCVHAAIGMQVGEIIIVDDNEDWRDSLAAILELEGYAVTGFADGESFLDEAAGRTPICIFLDVFMPGLSGLEVLERLAENAYPAPIFLISARIDAPVMLEALRNGVLGVIEKPFDPYTAVLRVRQAVDLRGQKPENKRADVLSGHRFVGDARLTPEECAMLKEIAAGTASEEAAVNLGISARAAAECRADVRRKLGARKFGELMGIGLAEDATREVSAGLKKKRRPSRRPVAGTHRDP